MDAAYMRAYRKIKYPERREKILAHLGGKCAACGARDGLQVDHIDPRSKSFDVMKIGQSFCWKRLVVELKKCQLLCSECHSRKTVSERGSVWARGTHGTLSAYRYCGPPKCPECRAAKRAWTRSYRLRVPRRDY